jgi:RNA polymerase sigma-70 factor, ECF subfamily
MTVAMDNAQLEEWIRRCASKDERALKALYDAVAPYLLGIMTRILRRRDLAEEALQDVFLKIWEQATQFDAVKGRAIPWLVSIARYRAIDIRRRDRRLITVGEDEQIFETASTDGAADGLLFASNSRALLQKCLQLLGGTQQKCLQLAYLDGLSHNEIAATVGEPLGTVKSWVRRSLQSLKRCLEA